MKPLLVRDFCVVSHRFERFRERTKTLVPQKEVSYLANAILFQAKPHQPGQRSDGIITTLAHIVKKGALSMVIVLYKSNCARGQLRRFLTLPCSDSQWEPAAAVGGDDQK